MSTLVVVPQTNEADSLITALVSAGVEVCGTMIGRVKGYRLSQLDALLAVAGHGKATFAATTSYLLCHYSQAHTVVCVGAAGALSPEVAVGDVIVSTATVEHDYLIKFSQQELPQHSTETASVDNLREIVSRTDLPFVVRFGKVASGDEDIVDARRASQLHQLTGALCVAWEGSGGARAAALHNRAFLEIRAITDGCDQNAAISFREKVAIAMPNAALLLNYWLSNTHDA